MEWLARPLVAAGQTVAWPLDPARLTDADLFGICLRMHAIFDSIEASRCEGRLIPRELFDAIDTLESMVVHGHRSAAGHSSPARLSEWADVIREFGVYYGLDGTGSITVDPTLFREAASRFDWRSATTPGP